MMQAEVASKITSPPGDSGRGFLTVWLQSLFVIHRLVKVPPGSFLPPPKVDSAVLVFTPRPTPSLDEAALELVRKGFSSPRKTLANNLKVEGANGSLLESLGLSASVRPHQLTEEQWQQLTMRLKELG
jgi:16S rRNA (adenine1518-N6/adenine1519-N6)-dimethyltransferase